MFNKTLLMVFMGLVSLRALGVFTDYTILLDSNFDYSLERFTSKQPIRFESLAGDKSQFSNYEEFLQYLSKRAPEMFQRPVFLHESGSVQHASFLRPRTLLFGRGSFFAFEEPPGSDEKRVEFIGFDEDSLSFNTGEIHFKKNGEVEFISNPQVCTSCHGTQTKPIWNPYDVWPKTFGAAAATMVTGSERQKYKEFYDSDKRGIYQFVELTDSDSSDFFNFAPLEEFTQYTNGLNLSKMMGEFKKQSTLRPFRYALIAALNACSTKATGTGQSETIDFDEYFPESLWAKFPTPIDFYLQDGSDSREYLLEKLKSRYLASFGEAYDFPATSRLDFEIPMIAQARFILENLGMSWRSLAMGHGENDYSVQEPGIINGNFGTAMAIYDGDLMRQIRPEIHDAMGLQATLFDCNLLKEKSVAELEQWTPDFSRAKLISYQDINEGLSPMASCVKCHDSIRSHQSPLTPFIPFGDTGALNAWMNSGQNWKTLLDQVDSGSMPKGRVLSAAEKEAIKGAFLRIKEMPPIQ